MWWVLRSDITYAKIRRHTGTMLPSKIPWPYTRDSLSTGSRGTSFSNKLWSELQMTSRSAIVNFPSLLCGRNPKAATTESHGNFASQAPEVGWICFQTLFFISTACNRFPSPGGPNPLPRQDTADGARRQQRHLASAEGRRRLPKVFDFLDQSIVGLGAMTSSLSPIKWLALGNVGTRVGLALFLKVEGPRVSIRFVRSVRVTSCARCPSTARWRPTCRTASS